MKRSDFYYHLPEERIAQFPIEPRDSSKMLVYHRESGIAEHRVFSEIIDYLKPGDLIVINKTKVLPARLFAKKEKTGGKVEFLLQKRINATDWEVMVKPGRVAKTGSRFIISDELSCEVLGSTDFGGRILRFEFEGTFEEILDRVGSMPLPHYIHEELHDNSRYQTVYAKDEGSSAAPTAGLHFTDRLMKEIREKGVQFAEIVLHVGLGTFRPVKVDDITDHKMHSEWYEISQEAADLINAAKREGRRVIAVGTTSVRTLESVAKEDGTVKACSGETNIFIYPPYRFKAVDALITNFHLPESTLIMLVSAFAGYENVMRLYKAAVDLEYRFFSFGDAMFIE